jgi:hypothetical protein
VRWGYEQGPSGSQAKLSSRRGAREWMMCPQTPLLQSVQTMEASWGPLVSSGKATPISLPVIPALHIFEHTQSLEFWLPVPTARQIMTYALFSYIPTN